MKGISPHVFRAYDIRGVAGETITGELARCVGKGFGSELVERYDLPHPAVIVGRDARSHSPLLEEAVIEGLLSTGCIVTCIGQTPSPLNYFTLCDRHADGSIQVTASHNPKEDNGLKLQLREAEAYAGEDLQVLRKRIEEDRFVHGEGSRGSTNAPEQYFDRLTSVVSMKRPLKIVADFGNGVSGPVYGEALRRAGIDLLPLFEEPDGTFPNHIADPSKHQTLSTLRQTVIEKGADCGIAFDGDGDRVGFVDEAGTIVPPDYILLLLAQDHLSRSQGSPVVYTVSMSSILETEVRRLGGEPIMCAVGHSFVEHEMRKAESDLGGEQSGHFFCGEGYYGFDDALVASLRLLSILAETDRPLSALIEDFPRVYQTPEWRPHCPDDRKTAIISLITEHFRHAHPCVTIDGVRIDFGDGAWAGIRQSNTSPKISVCMEARSEEKLREVESAVRSHLAQYPEIGTA